MDMNVETSVLARYSEGALERQEDLCCPVDYDATLLDMLPAEIIERDYGCGDPSRYVQAGDTVLDLGSGGGKICYMAAQLVGTDGQVIGIDMNDDMLALARSYQQAMADQLGGDRVRFLKGQIQDLALDVEALERHLAEQPVQSHADFAQLQNWIKAQRRSSPLIADNSVDLVISNCVLNLVADTEKQQMVQEIFRVLKPGGRIAIADIVSDRNVPAAMKQDPELWSGCISGAFQEQAFLEAFAAAGFQGICLDKWDPEPWRVIDDIIFRSATVTACKPLAHDNRQETALIYRGPFASVTDDAGQTYARGIRTQVTAETAARLASAGYRDAFINTESSANTSGCCDSAAKTGRGGCC